MFVTMLTGFIFIDNLWKEIGKLESEWWSEKQI